MTRARPCAGPRPDWRQARRRTAPRRAGDGGDRRRAGARTRGERSCAHSTGSARWPAAADRLARRGHATLKAPMLSWFRPRRPAFRRAARRAAHWRDGAAPGAARRHGRPGVRVRRRPVGARRRTSTPTTRTRTRCTARSVTGCDRSASSKTRSPARRSWSRPSMSSIRPRSRHDSSPRRPSSRAPPRS